MVSERMEGTPSKGGRVQERASSVPQPVDCLEPGQLRQHNVTGKLRLYFIIEFDERGIIPSWRVLTCNVLISLNTCYLLQVTRRISG